MFNFLKKNNLVAPVNGKIIPIEEVPDPVFAQKMMGEGIAIIPEDSSFVAPADGTITLISETKHAFGMTLDNGMELLVHIGLETVNHKGEGFNTLVEVNTKVKQGTPIISIDRAFMESKNINLTTPLVILNHSLFNISFLNNDTAKAGETVLITYKKK